jgi:hypothetical protein
MKRILGETTNPETSGPDFLLLTDNEEVEVWLIDAVNV